MSEPIKVFRAKRIHTMSSNMPVATHVAVKEGRILAVGTKADCALWGEIEVDDRFADKILMPGFVEAHGHVMEGAIWNDLYLGYFTRYSPDGTLEGGLKDIDAVVARLQEAEAALEDPDAPLLAWGFDPIYFDGERMTRDHLDRVSTTRPVIVAHASLHLMNVNTKVMELGDMLDSNVEGILRDTNGVATGELQEMAAMMMAQKACGASFAMRMVNEDVVRRYGASAVNAGVTTAADLHQQMDPGALEAFQAVTQEEGFPLRVVPALGAIQWDIEKGIEKALSMRKQGNDKLYLGIVKVMTDGSIQGFTGRLKWPGYFNGAPNGIWNLPPATLKQIIKSYNAAGIQMHVHVNGDQASEFVLDCFTEALAEAPFPDHRHTLQHCQMADRAQFKRMKALGCSVNLFANHIFYWGEQHAALTMGPDRARRMDACATALDEGVPLSIHSDVPVTPLDRLFSAWCAVNRITPKGRVLGPEECIPVEAAMKAITIGAAYQLKLDHLVGSVEIGKFADFAVLDEDPYEVAPEALKDIRVAGTVVGGIWTESAIPA